MRRHVSLRLFLMPVIFVFMIIAGMPREGSGLDPVQKAMYLAMYRYELRQAGFSPADLENYSIGQSHIDAAWRWRKAQTRTKCIKTFSKAVEHMEKYSDFIYAQSAPQYYEWVMEDDPALFEKIKYWEKQGRWEIVGGQWVEPDNNMPDGESFVRQRLLGQRFYMEHFGHISEISWLLDSFGYQWNLPQILAKSGAKYFWTNKLTWNDTTVFPFHLFWWQAPDGSRVLAYFVQHCPGVPFYPYSELDKYKNTRYLLPQGAAEFVANYATDPKLIRETMTGEWLNVIGVFYGVGDGGHGPLEKEIQIQQMLQEHGYTKFSTARELYAALDKYKDRAPVWNDELYLEFHRGCQATQAQNKRNNRQSEQMMRTAEVIRSVALRLGLAYPYEKLKAVWKLVLLNQFHDILPGSSIPEVYEDSEQDYTQIKRTASEAITQGLNFLAGLVNTKAAQASLKPLLVFNTLSWERSGCARVRLHGEQGPFHVLDADGRPVPAQRETAAPGREETLLFYAENIPAMGYKLYYLAPGHAETNFEPGTPEVAYQGDLLSLENDKVAVLVDKHTGWLTSVKDKTSGKEFLDGYGNQLMAWNDRPEMYSAWNIAPDYLSKPYPMPDAQNVRITAQGPLFVEVEAIRKFMHSDIRQVIRLYRNDPAVSLITHFDFHDADVLVKQGFDTTIVTDKVAAEISYAVIERATRPQTPADKARWEKVCHKWLDLSDGEFGLALLNNGKYGFSITEDGTGFRLSLLKAAHRPKATPGAENVRGADLPWGIRSLLKTAITDQGPHTAWTALLPHRGDWREARLWQAGYEFNTPLEVMMTDQHHGILPACGSFMQLDNPEVFIGAVKKAEDDDDLVIRLVEAAGRENRVRLSLNYIGAIDQAVETDLLEWNPVQLSPAGNTLEVAMKPHEIKTLKLRLK